MLNPYWSRPEPKWQSSKVIPLHIGNARTILLPVERLSLTHYIAYVQHDKPVLLPIWVGRPQGPTMEVRVEEDGESECQIVMTWIGIEPSATLSRTKVSRLPSGPSMQEADANDLKRRKHENGSYYN